MTERPNMPAARVVMPSTTPPPAYNLTKTAATDWLRELIGALAGQIRPLAMAVKNNAEATVQANADILQRLDALEARLDDVETALAHIDGGAP